MSEPPKCPKCKKPVLGIGRSYSGGTKLVSVEIYHFDPELVARGDGPRNCKIKMTYGDSQTLADAVCGDMGNRK